MRNKSAAAWNLAARHTVWTPTFTFTPALYPVGPGGVN